ncbi:proline--tRNA ligase [Methanobacterium petrolearium]|uniref:proline--tRNA ligase n=1 Tax=Methanobacterium petrolearium TaxID=710190 RepID=UPI001AE9D80F|nr:proline--tRNA ligase [Methanobacterium petrolearium]MBP1945373.1 prolyl-tRNA synthetase [Methanobacterium petrolearium]BDZ71562.1 proline--tRNA ligase [Methanobacterium petrolearium]
MSEFSEWFHNILEEAQIIDTRYPIKGMHVWQPQGFKIRKYALKLLRELLDEDHEEVLFPLLIPEDELAKEAIHVKGFEEEVYWVTHGGLTPLNKKLALRPTSETAMYPMFNLWVRSHTDLPMKLYQIVNTFRYETKHTRPLIRVREITTFKEAHTIHVDYEGAQKQVENAIELYSNFFDYLGIPFVVTRRPDWDKFPGADYTMAFDTLMPDGKTLQIGTVHNLGQTFAHTFDITYETAEGEHEHVYQTCYGLSDRVIASIIGIHGDSSGLVLPPSVAPYQVVIVPVLFKKGAQTVLDFCNHLKNMLKDNGIRVHLDDRDLRAGKKYYEWEMRGVPLRLEIGLRDIENKKIVLLRRDTMDKETFDYQEETIITDLNKILNGITQNLKTMAWEKFNSDIRPATSLQDALDILKEDKGIVSFDWCGDESCGREIEEIVKVDILGVSEEVHEGKCINCGSPAKSRALLAKTY